MRFLKTRIPEVVIVEPTVFADARGFFMEVWKESSFVENGISARFVQDNQSRSRKGTLRGLHYQINQPQGKLVRAVAGEIYDVAVDLRKSSPNFGKWFGAALSAENKRMLWVPPGFAHGFYVTSELAEVAYKCTNYHVPEHERVIIWNDPDLGVQWPVPNGSNPTLSDKDATGTPFAKAEHYH
ncbi:MAG: dTDP-4-dehydrorhamnose 3,5-epimerase [Nitrospinae bacterium]|nr:dTDP-4-dehydrorhamnose 3,5-epimerase [Nitrospinota bacterium]